MADTASALYERSNSGVLVPKFDYDDVVELDDEDAGRESGARTDEEEEEDDKEEEDGLRIESDFARAYTPRDEVMSPTSSSSNGSSGESHAHGRGRRAAAKKRQGDRSSAGTASARASSVTKPGGGRHDGGGGDDDDDDAEEGEENRFQLAISLDFETDTTPSVGGTPVIGPESATRKTSESFSDLGDYDDFSLAESTTPGGGTGTGSSTGGGTPNGIIGTFYPIYEEDAYRIIHSSMGSAGGSFSSGQDAPHVSDRGGVMHQYYSPSKSGRTGGRTTPTIRFGVPADESQPLVGSIYPVAGEILHMKAENAAYIIFYKTRESEDGDAKIGDALYSSSSSEESSDTSGGEFGDDSALVSTRPPRSYASLGAAGNKVQTDNCFTRDNTHPTRSIGRGLFRASTSVGSAFLKGAAGLVNQTYQGGASGGVFGFAKGLGMGMLGLGTHTVKGAFRGVGQVTNLVGEMMLGTAPHFSIDGTLALTNHRIIWISQSTKDAMEIPISSILTLESSTTAPHVANIESKNLLKASIAFQDETTCYQFLSSVWEFYAEAPYVFAHIHYDALARRDGGGNAGFVETPAHRFYDPEEDYRRLNLLNEESWMRLYDNSDYALFPSYPEAFVIPSILDEYDLRELSAYRSASRIPVVVWRHPHTGALVCRCAQPCAGLSGYVVEADQKLVAALQRATSASVDSVFHFFDARSQIAATANAAQGKGTEDPRNYPNSELHFCDIANIHAVRSSYSSLSSACQPGQEKYGTEWEFQLRNTFWFMHISRILAASQAICRYLCQGESVMIHCSDGWDRTPQLTALVQLLLDPFYRTLDGFLQLVEKEWCSFGHMFRHRYAQGEGPGQQELEEQSPVFVQWIDAVWQIWRQQPWAFEFNEAVLASLYENVFSGLYGTFLYNCERERKFREGDKPTASLWCVLLNAREKFLNVEYDGAKNFNSIGLILPFSAEEDDLVMWEDHLMYADPVCRKYE
ncbi:hypothetical protein PybrP1_007322 [[Pythium] brassicae (nom. inval.)]|nr:hypothetical protein PybrP1_007322 [[Pythium] brassicae (nom. inval.)]